MLKFYSLLPLLSILLAPNNASPTCARTLLGTNFGNPANATYDYVVVGGGTAGLAIAARLAEDERNSVAVIEAGSFYELSTGNISQIPALAAFWAGKDLNDTNPTVDWGLKTVPQPMAGNIPLHVPRGKTLGGSSARNFMAYHRGTAGSYQKWVDLLDDHSYTFDALLQFFERSVTFTPPDNAKRFTNATPEWDPQTLKASYSPLHVSFPNYAQAFSTWARLAFEDLGFESILGFNSGKLIGASWAPTTTNPDTAERDSSETSFLRYSLGKPNYRVYINTLAKNIVFEDKRAAGVEVDTLGARYTLSASKEVIVSGGAYHSPQLLLVSGIGPAALLRGLNISVVSDRPGVGQNFQDHTIFGSAYRVNVQTASAVGDPKLYMEAVDLFNKNAAGFLASNGADFLGWEKLPEKLRAKFTKEIREALASFPADWPEVEYLPISAYFGDQFNYITGAPTDGFNYASVMASNVAPLSRGTVSIGSADTSDLPVIDPKWLDHPVDKAVAVAAFKRTRELWHSPSLNKVTIGEEYFPGRAVQSDEEILQFLKRSFSTINHGCCTCAMGRVKDSNAVLDSQARVIGVDGLRVVDASAFPLLPPGHPQATVYMLAEKIAYDIIQTYDPIQSDRKRDEL